MSQFPLEVIRHSAAHVLAQAVLKFFPDAKLGIGPAIAEGFYYDFELSRSLNDEDLEKIESEMVSILKEDQTFSQYNKSKSEAITLLDSSNQSYKLELIDDLGLDDYSFYENGPFVDLCRGPHVEKTSEIGVIKLLKTSGAYWRGSENNTMLQRIYGTAFHTQEQLDAYLHQLEEAKKRDHRVLGKALDLFSIQDAIGGGLVLWHPKGSRIRHIMETYWKESHFKQGYELLHTPHLGRADLWKTSGHLDFYEENMYSAMKVDEQDYFMKPMNCPFHILTYNASQHSYRNLPLRYAELGTVYRYERSGVLHGLMRVRGFTQDDAHIICTQDQIHDEIQTVLKFCLDMLNVFGFEDVSIYVSTRPKEKYVGALEHWDTAQNALESAVNELGLSFNIDDGGGAFYGPKIDIKIKDAIGREWQCSTIQFDFNLPDRFDMTYVASDGSKQRPFVVHRALLGSIERFFGILIEHYEGKFPFWLAPFQVKIVTLGESQAEYAQALKTELTEQGFRVDVDASSEKLGYKIRAGIGEKVPYLLIIGKKEIEAGTVSVRSRDQGDLGSKTMDELKALFSTEFNPCL